MSHKTPTSTSIPLTSEELEALKILLSDEELKKALIDKIKKDNQPK